MGKQSLARLATFVAGFSAFQVVITARYGVNDLKATCRSCTARRASRARASRSSSRTADRRRALPRLHERPAIIGQHPRPLPAGGHGRHHQRRAPAVKRAGLPDTRDNCWDYFINQVRANLHVILCFSPIGDPIKVRTRRFPALVNCVVIDWFQPWPEEALASVSKRFLDDVDLGDDEVKAAVIELHALLLPRRREELGGVPRAGGPLQLHDAQVVPRADRALQDHARERREQTRRDDHALVQRRRSSSRRRPSVGELEEELKVKAVEVEEKKAAVDAMIPKLEEEKAKAGDEAAKANDIADAATKKEAEVMEMKADIEKDLAAAEPALVAAAAALDSLNKKDLGELKSLKRRPRASTT